MRFSELALSVKFVDGSNPFLSLLEMGPTAMHSSPIFSSLLRLRRGVTYLRATQRLVPVSSSSIVP